MLNIDYVGFKIVQDLDGFRLTSELPLSQNKLLDFGKHLSSIIGLNSRQEMLICQILMDVEHGWENKHM